MLKFILAGWANLKGGDPMWLINDEERNFEAFLLQCLASYGCYLEEELAASALVALAKGKATVAEPRPAHILVDDYSSLSREAVSRRMAVGRAVFSLRSRNTEPRNKSPGWKGTTMNKFDLTK
ncbi:hypothetical protein PZH32_11600, partial [Adlercreutzia equolifaciens]|uniref:hypothetical protein n=1 Tax=Adlercreutzia equolifaciens TaxID=446660 RepID=UPI0023AFEB75